MTTAKDIIEEVKEWWKDNALKGTSDWEAFIELGEILTQEITEEEDDLSWGPPTKANPVIEAFPPSPFVEPEPVKLDLDPLPYVIHYGTSMEERFSFMDPYRVRATWKPRPGFEPDRSKYLPQR